MNNNEHNIFHINQFQPSVAFHTETSHFDLQGKSNDWFLYKNALLG